MTGAGGTAGEVTAGDVLWPADAPSREEFVARVWEEGRRLYRDLPWRGIDDAYAVLVSEVMLQQTQVKRVLDYWPRFLAAFPTPDALAAASVSDVLGFWQGLGYNRRALALKRAAEVCSAEYGGAVPDTYEALVALPGVGPATAAGVLSFAFQKPAVYLETNVRSVFLHELFPGEEGVSDKRLQPLVEATVSHDDPRGWYYALLDYGADLKTHTANPSRRSATYTRQSKFEGSRRQKRAWVVREVLARDGAPVSAAELAAGLDRAETAAGRPAVDPQEFASIIGDLAAEGFFRLEDGLVQA